MMPRDMELIRTLLLRFERDDTSIPDGYTQEQVAYHVKQMKLFGLVDAEVIEAPSPGKLKPHSFIVRDLTPEGHDFIAKIRNDTLWSKIKAEVASRGVPLTLDLMIQIAAHVTVGRLKS
jgi:hypothetical protein